jgi:uncharacterized membrane protein YccF (DUF307 family)
MIQSSSTRQRQEEAPEQRRAPAEVSPEQRYERGLQQQHFYGVAQSPQPAYPGGLPPQQQAYQGQQSPIVVQNFYQAPPPMPMQPPIMVNVVSPPNFLLRALWFIFIGWWAGLIWLHIGFALCVSVIFLPVGLMMLNRLPGVLTLQPSSQQTTVTMYQNGMVSVRVGEPQQIDFLLRALYFLAIGWWLGYMWALLGYIFCFTIILMPIGIMMLNRLPTVLTLRQM